MIDGFVFAFGFEVLLSGGGETAKVIEHVEGDDLIFGFDCPG